MKAGIYVHIPFCLKKCHYCSFNSIPYNRKTAEGYVTALKQEIVSCVHPHPRPSPLKGEGIKELEPISLYVGGGTPTVLPWEGLSSLLDLLFEKFKIQEGTEATLEANPGTLGGIDLGGLLRLGINRVSLGAQSFDPAELKMLGRLHGPEEVAGSVRRLKEAGCRNIGIDLIYSLPGQDIASWKRSLERALELDTQHISLYGLSIEEGTALYAEFKAGRLVSPPEPVQVDMYLLAVEMLEKAGFKRYEISNFARPGFECLHNLNYWSCGEYIGLGAGAHSYIGGVRSENAASIREYIEALTKGGSPAAASEELSGGEKEREYIMLGLRKAEGIDLAEFKELFGRDLGVSAREKIMALKAAGYLEPEEARLRLTIKGVLASNSVTSLFFNPPPSGRGAG